MAEQKKVAQRVGKKRALIIVTFPLFACWILVYLADNLTLLMLSRFLGGFAGGGMFALVPRFVEALVWLLSFVNVRTGQVDSQRYKQLHNENRYLVI